MSIRPQSCPASRRQRATGTLIGAAAALVTLLPSTPASAIWWGTYGSWDTQARKDAADAALLAVVTRFNNYGDFNGGSDGWIDVYYNAGVPTANASWGGAMTFGGTWPGERVALHEANHWLGSVYGHAMDGPRAIATLEQFDGVGARYGNDGTHFWPYGMNYDSEWSEVGAQRNIAIMYALRGDWGVGPTTNPTAWAATNVTLTNHDALGESGFNFGSKWSDNTFAHPNADYSTGNFLLRTPASGASFNFAGNSVSINNTNGIDGGLLYKGTGNTGVTSFKNLNLNGGYVRHANGASDLFRLAGKVTLTGSPTINAHQGAIAVTATVSGPGSFTKTGTFPLVLSTGATYSGDTNITAGVLRLGAVSPVAAYSFDSVSGSTVNNTGTGGTGMNGALAGGASIVAGGRFGNAVSIPSGASVDINNGILDLHTAGNWTVSVWVKTATQGASLLSKSNGSSWNYGNTVFYLGDGTDGGSGRIPSSVRWAGGYFQGSPAATNVADNSWHLVTYVNAGDNYGIYIDGVAQPLSPANSRLSVPDIGSIVRLGYTVNNGAFDGTVQLNGQLDDVRFYNQALSATQVASLYQGQNVTGTLPSTTNVNISAGATLDLAGATQQIAALNGPTGASVTLGTGGKLTVSPATSSTFAGNISGTSGSLTKTGTGHLTLSGTNSYTGLTTVADGTLTLRPTAFAPVLTGAGGADITLGRLILDYTGASTPLTTVRSRLASGAIRSSLADATHTLGYYDNGASVTVLLTLAGDANLDGALTADDYTLLDKGLATSASVWWLGDFNYDGTVTSADYLLLDQAWQQQGGQFSPAFLSQRESQFGSGYVSQLLVAVPEPGLALGSLLPSLLLRRRSGR